MVFYNSFITNAFKRIFFVNVVTSRVRKTVREQLEEITNLGLNKYHMKRTELRKLVEEIFRIHGVSDSWLRKLLPVELKDSSKTRISYQQRQDIEKESQRLLQLQQQQDLGSQHESEIRESSHPNAESLSCQFTEEEIRVEELEYPSEYHSQNHEMLSSSDSKEPDKVRDAYKNKIEKLEADVRQLSEQFVAKANLQASTKTFPLIAHIDPVKKEIKQIQFEKGSGI
ncbi:MAG: hypothetical protein WBL67_20750 [Nitrososphaeraceae archaeon]